MYFVSENNGINYAERSQIVDLVSSTLVISSPALPTTYILWSKPVPGLAMDLICVQAWVRSLNGSVGEPTGLEEVDD